MGKTKQTIELNGKRYDAVTGALVNDVVPSSVPIKPVSPPASTTPPQPVIPPTPSGGGLNLDGFVRRAKSAPSTHHIAKKKKPVHAHTPQHSHTLMRHAVKKPAGHVPIKSEADSPKPVHLPKQHHTAREERAQSSSRSSMVSKFGSGKTSVTTTVADLPVQPHPTETSYVPPAAPPINPIITPATAHKTQRNGADLFTQALQNIDAQPVEPLASPKKTKKKSRLVKGLGAGTLGLVTVLAISFVAYISMPTISLKLANTRAGFSASLPGFSPAGYVLQDSITANHGNVTLKYNSPGGNQGSYQLVQQPSDWNSQALLANYVTSQGAYQIYPDNGRTIYIYGNHDATWVNGGIWYLVKGNPNLSTDDLLHIANSI